MNDTEQQAFKDKTLTRLYKSGFVHDKILGIASRHTHYDSYIHEDILQEVFFHLSKYPNDKFIELMSRNPDKLIGLAVRIAILKGVTKNSVIPDYPKHSVLTNILFASNLNKANYKPPAGCEDEDNFEFTIPENTELEHEIFWSEIKEDLNPDEIIFLDTYLNSKKKTGRYKASEKLKLDNLIDKIKIIIKRNG